MSRVLRAILSVLVSLLLVTGTVDIAARADDGPEADLRRYPRQDCGVNCMLVLCKLENLPVEKAELSRLVHVEDYGTTMLSLSSALQTLGFGTAGVRTTLPELADIGLPAIAHLSGNHFVVLADTTREKTVVVDLPLTPRERTEKDLSSTWDGAALLASREMLILRSDDSTLPDGRWQKKIVVHSRGIRRLALRSVAPAEELWPYGTAEAGAEAPSSLEWRSTPRRIEPGKVGILTVSGRGDPPHALYVRTDGSARLDWLVDLEVERSMNNELRNAHVLGDGKRLRATLVNNSVEDFKVAGIVSSAGAGAFRATVESLVVPPGGSTPLECRFEDRIAEDSVLYLRVEAKDGRIADTTIVPGEESEHAGSMGPPAPALRFEEAEYDAGQVVQGTEVKHTFRFQNICGRELQLQSVRASCGCALTEYPQGVLGPGSWGELTVTVDTSSEEGRQSYRIWVNTYGDRGNPGVLSLALTVLVPAHTVPSRLSFGQVDQGSVHGRCLVVQGYAEDAALRVLSAESTSPYLQTRVVNASAGETEFARVAVRLKEDAPPGELSGKVVVHTSDPRSPRLEVPVTATVTGGVKVFPKRLVFAQKENGETVRGTIECRLSADRKGSRVLGVSSDTPAIVPQLTQVSDDLYEVVVTVTRRERPSVRGNVLVRTDDPDEPELRIPVTCLFARSSSARK